MKTLPTEIGIKALRSLFREGSALGPLRVLFEHMGNFFQIPLPAFHPFVVAGPEANRRVLVTEREKLLWRNPDPVTDLLQRGLLVTDGPEHDRYRGLMEPWLHPARLPSYHAMMKQQSDRVTSHWADGETIDMLKEGRKIALLIIMEALFSVDVWNDLPLLWKPILKSIQYISPGPWILWRRIPRPGFRKPIKALDEYLFGIIRDRRKGAAKEDLLQHLIDAGLDDERIRDQMLTMLIAGHDTSTALLAWTFYLLGTHPEIQSRLAQEIENVEKSPLLDQVIKESLRLYPPIHLGNRITLKAIDFNEEVVPAGERLFYSIYLTHRDPGHWKKPHEFCPERFAHGRKTPPFSYVPFGGGPRACIGAAFGQAEARVVIKRLLETFSFELVSTKVHAHMGATLEPRPGVFLRVQERK